MALGRGFGKLRMGEWVVKTGELEIGTILLMVSPQFQDAENTVKVTKLFPERVWGRYVDPDNVSTCWGDEFCIWDFELSVSIGESRLWKAVPAIRKQDFSIEADAQGYIIRYKDHNIGGASILNKFKGRGKAHAPFLNRAAEQAHDYRTQAKREIDELVAGRGQVRLKFEIDRIDGVVMHHSIAITEWLKERYADAASICEVLSINRHSLNTFKVSVPGVAYPVWVRADRDSRIGKDFITWEYPA